MRQNMWPLVIVLVAVALRRTRWAAPALVASRTAYAAYIVLGLAYFPMKGGAGLSVPECQWTFGPALAVHSLTNYAHIILLAFFFLLTYAQLPNVRHAIALSFAACIVMGFLVEIAQGSSGEGNCRMRDLIPDTAGALAGALLVLGGRKVQALLSSRASRSRRSPESSPATRPSSCRRGTPGSR
ncbi:MAG: VanZ family protein [Thermoanaerobaculia bacterium]